MSRIKAKDTKPEILVRKFLFAKGFRYRLHAKELPGKPDIVLPKYNAIIFIHGCFWHGHEDCFYYVVPRTRTEWWLNKINGNKKKDAENILMLRNGNWHVKVIWECELKTSLRDLTLAETIFFIKNGDTGN